MIAATVYVLCTLTSALCALLLLRRFRASNVRLLFWSGLAFAGFAVSNALVLVDQYAVPHTDLGVLRAASAFVSVALLLYGLLWDIE